jgi:hypothetical protein
MEEQHEDHSVAMAPTTEELQRRKVELEKEMVVVADGVGGSAAKRRGGGEGRGGALRVARRGVTASAVRRQNARGEARFRYTSTRRVSSCLLGLSPAETGLPNGPASVFWCF